MPGKKRISPVPAKIRIVDDAGIPTKEFTRYLMEIVGIDPMQAFPVGAILAFSGKEADIPENWHICNGEDGTPDFHDKFILGTNDPNTIGELGGYAEPQLKSHTHSIDHNHASVTTGGESGHTHDYTNYPGYNGYTTQDETGWQINTISGNTEETGSSSGHTHSVNLPNYVGNSGSKEIGDQATGNYPPYYKVIYIIKIEPILRSRR